MFNQPLIEISLPLSTAYLTYFLAESVFGVSGVLAVVTLGVYFSAVGRVYISPEVESYLHSFWEMLAHSANTVIFLLAGIYSSTSMSSSTATDFGWLLLLYVAVTVIRAAVVASLSPLLKMSGYGISAERAALIVWGGLRGAVSLALALSVRLDERLIRLSSTDATGPPPVGEGGEAALHVAFANSSVNATAAMAATARLEGTTADAGSRASLHSNPRMTDLIFFHTSGLVMLTLLVNATTVEKLVRALGLDRVSPSKELLFNVAMQEIDRAGEREEMHLKTDPLYGCARWDDVRAYKWSCKPAKVFNIGHGRKGLSVATSFRMNARAEATRRFLIAVKASYWQQFRDGLVGRAAVRDLVETVDRALDQGKASEWEVRCVFSVVAVGLVALLPARSWLLGQVTDAHSGSLTPAHYAPRVRRPSTAPSRAPKSGTGRRPFYDTP